MLSLTKSLTLAAVVALATVAVALASTASAQTMGEYGAVMGNAAASAGAAPSIGAPDLGGGSFKADTQSNSGPSQTIVIHGSDSEEAAPRRSRNRAAEDTDRNDSADDWVQVR